MEALCPCEVDESSREACRTVPGLLKPTLKEIYIPLDPPSVRRETAARFEKLKTTKNARHPTKRRESVPKRLTIEPTSMKHSYTSKTPPNQNGTAIFSEKNERKADLPDKLWVILNRMPSGVGRTDANKVKWRPKI